MKAKAKSVDQTIVLLSKEALSLIGIYKTITGTELQVIKSIVRNMEVLEWGTVRELGHNQLRTPVTLMEIQKKINAKLIERIA